MNWPVVQLADVASIERHGIAAEEIVAGSLYVGLENITRDGTFSDVRSVTNGELASSKFTFTSQHLLYGKLRPNLSKIARPTFDGVCSTDILPVLPGPTLDRDYLHHFLRQPQLIDFAASRAVGINLPRLSPSLLATFEIPLPPLTEQKRIAAILDAADALRAKRRTALAKLDQLAQSIFIEMFGDPNFNQRKLPKIPLGELIKVKSGENLVAAEMASGGQYPVYGGNGINGYHDAFMFEERKVCIGRVGVYCGVVHLTEPNAWITDNALYVSDISDRLHRDYLLAALRLANLNQYAGRAAQPLVSGSRIYPVEVLVPPIQHQVAFSAVVTSTVSVRNKIAQASERLVTLFSSLQYRAFKGEL